MVDPFDEQMAEYRRQLEKGVIQKAYRGLMAYLMDVRTQFAGRHPEYPVAGSLYFGYMDMSYFSVFPESLKQRRLKVAVVFLHEACRFEVWLAGANKQVQAETWKLIKGSGWDKYPLVPTTKGADSILEQVLADKPNFRDLEALTEQIERGTLEFIAEVEGFLAAQGG